MTTLLTNGKQVLEPDLVEFQPIERDARSHRPLRLESELFFGPVREKLLAKKGVLWWGTFSVADRVGLTVYATRESRLRVRILDLGFRVLEERAQQGTLRISASVAQSGLVFFHLVNEGDSGELVFLQVASKRSGMFVPAAPSRRRSVLARLLCFLRRAPPTLPAFPSRLDLGGASH